MRPSALTLIDEPLAGDFLPRLDEWMQATDAALDAIDVKPMLRTLAVCRERVADALAEEADAMQRHRLRQIYDALEAAGRIIDCEVTG